MLLLLIWGVGATHFELLKSIIDQVLTLTRSVMTFLHITQFSNVF